MKENPSTAGKDLMIWLIENSKRWYVFLPWTFVSLIVGTLDVFLLPALGFLGIFVLGVMVTIKTADEEREKKKK